MLDVELVVKQASLCQPQVTRDMYLSQGEIELLSNTNSTLQGGTFEVWH